MNRHRRKCRAQKAIDAITKILFKADVENIISHKRAQKTEYRGEARTLVGVYGHLFRSHEDVAIALGWIFDQSFTVGCGNPKDDFSSPPIDSPARYGTFKPECFHKISPIIFSILEKYELTKDTSYLNKLFSKSQIRRGFL